MLTVLSDYDISNSCPRFYILFMFVLSTLLATVIWFVYSHSSKLYIFFGTVAVKRWLYISEWYHWNRPVPKDKNAHINWEMLKMTGMQRISTECVFEWFFDVNWYYSIWHPMTVNKQVNNGLGVKSHQFCTDIDIVSSSINHDHLPRNHWNKLKLQSIAIKFVDLPGIRLHGNSSALAISVFVSIIVIELVLNLLVLGRSGCDFIIAIFNLILLIIVFRSSCDNALRWMSLDLTDNKSKLVQVMAWCH